MYIFRTFRLKGSPLSTKSLSNRLLYLITKLTKINFPYIFFCGKSQDLVLELYKLIKNLKYIGGNCFFLSFNSFNFNYEFFNCCILLGMKFSVFPIPYVIDFRMKI